MSKAAILVITNSEGDVISARVFSGARSVRAACDCLLGLIPSTAQSRWGRYLAQVIEERTVNFAGRYGGWNYSIEVTEVTNVD